MRNLFVFALVGLFSTAALADDVIEALNKSTIEYRCKFEGKGHDEWDKPEELECWVEGLLCYEFGGPGGALGRKCENREDPIRIKCSDGFELRSEDASINLDNNDLWINAKRHAKIATIHVEDFFDRTAREGDWRREAHLLYTKGDSCHAHALEGVCNFRKKEENGPPVPLN